MLLRFRDGDVTLQDIETINSRIPGKDTILPEDLRYATFFNVDRDAINSAIFQERVTEIYHAKNNTDGFIIVFSDHLMFKNSDNRYVPFRRHKLFWEQCGENDVDMDRRGRMDPVLKLYQGCRIMLPTNSNVDAGLANGTQARIQKVVLKTGEKASYIHLDNNIPVQAVFASQVDHVILKHSNSRIQPQYFQVKPKEHTFKANIPKPWIVQTNGNKNTEKVQMKALQLPILINNATTGHKLQGSGVDHLFVHSWYYVQNWIYTMLSRVTSLDGLFARNRLSTDLKKYSVPKSLIKMISNFRSKKPTMFTEEEYNDIKHGTYNRQQY